MYTCLPPNADPFFFDGEDLREIADEATVKAGLTLFKDHQVIACDQESDLLWGKVADDQWDMPPDVQLRLAADGRLSFDCACGQAVCAHQVAVLLAYGDQRGETGQLLSAADTAIRDRKKRGRTEVRVENTSGEPWFGTWRAWSLSSAPGHRTGGAVPAGLRLFYPQLRTVAP